jgi:Histidine kinase/Histidine kinase-, DNA gyrase B-, and HSP90-like ATPase
MSTLPTTYTAVPSARLVAGTVALNTVIAATLTAFGSTPFLHNLVFSQCIGLMTYGMIDIPRRSLWPVGAPALLPMIGIVFAAALIGWQGGSRLAAWMLGVNYLPTNHGPDAALGFFMLTAAAGFGGTFYFWTRERIAATERGATEARLKLLSAQIEPHFLFNTLANLQALIAIDPPRAQAMLGHLDAYLRASLAATRTEAATLGDEFALLRGYLEIIAMRMGARLAFELVLPEALAPRRLPPMLLQPLVENAITHGLEPKIDGGRVTVRAQEDGGMLVLVVEDTGLGLSPQAATAGTGVGVGNVRERLAATWGQRASLALDDNPGGGTRATLRLPALP